MNDLAKQMAPIRDSIARTREKVEQIERLLVTATEAEAMEFTSAAYAAGVKAVTPPPGHIPKSVVPSRLDAEYLMEFIGAHGPLHTRGCPGDDTCACPYRPINDAANKCARFVFHFAHGPQAAAVEKIRKEF